jgi:hypothetical protein
VGVQNKMKRTYFFATYKLGNNSADMATIIEAKDEAQIKRAGMHLFADYKRCETRQDAFYYFCEYNISYVDVKEFNVTKF